MWKIHGKLYNLHPFMNKHPGGAQILKSCLDDFDVTYAFESYHALCDMNKIKKIMKKYEIKQTNLPNMKFEQNDFYKTLQRRVKKVLKNNYKSDYRLFIRIFIQSLLFLINFIIAFYCNLISIKYRIIAAIIAANFFIQIGFCAMHDASHMAISKNKYINELISNIWNSIALWDSQLWNQHHVIRHHAYTGDHNKDPDTIHFKPLIRKSDLISNKGYLNIPKNYSILLSFISVFILPGMFVGQSILYHCVWLKRKYLWKITLQKMYNISIWQSIIKLFMLYTYFQCNNVLIFIAYAITLNISYAICILPDHDTMETHKNYLKDTNGKDWGEIQVRNSGNFCNDNNWICTLFGGINYQIEHHLFPTVCHIHFPKIKPIVKKTCDEFKVPYVHHDSLFNAVYSVFKQYEKSS